MLQMQSHKFTSLRVTTNPPTVKYGMRSDSADRARERLRYLATQDLNLSIHVLDAYCALGVGVPFAQRTEAIANALLNLRQCSPVVMRSADAESDGVLPSLVPLLVDYLNSLVPTEMMLIRNRDGNLLAPLFEPPVPSEEAEQVKCSSCDVETFRADFVTCPVTAPCEFCRECFVSLAVEVVNGDSSCCKCLNCGKVIAAKLAAAHLETLLGVDSPSSNLVVQLRRKLDSATKRTCPLHATVELSTVATPEGNGFCLHCGKVYCVSCLNAAHGEMSCDEALAERSRDQVQRWRLILEQILSLSCPRCKKVFNGVDGCFDVHCAKDEVQDAQTCACHFCGFCNKDCGFDAHPHLDPNREGPCPLQRKYFPHLNIFGHEGDEGINPPYFFPQRYLKLGTGVRIVKKIKNLLKNEFRQQCAAELAGREHHTTSGGDDSVMALFDAVRRDVLPQLLAGGGFVRPDSFRNYPNRSPSAFSEEHGVAADDCSSDEELVNHPEVSEEMLSQEAFLLAQADELGIGVDELRELLEAQVALDAAA
jgi:hypothetical protein